MSRLLTTFRPSGSAWLWAVCGLVAVSLTQGTGNQSGLARAGVARCCYETDHGHFPKKSSLYEATTYPNYPTAPIPIELLSLSMQSIPPLSVELPQPGTSVQSRSFFDVFADLAVGGGTQHVDSFFDITYRLDGVSGGPTTGSADLEILSITPVSPLPFMIRESPTLQSTGHHSITEQSPGGPYRIDSFFDVFTELSFDGGSSWIPASGPIHMDLTRVGVPEPASLMLAAMVGLTGLAVQLCRRRKSA